MVECLQYEGLTQKVPDVIFVRARQARLLHSGPARIVIIALREIEKIITRLTLCHSKKEFIELRGKVFLDYTNLSYILSNSFSISDDRAIRQAAMRQAFKAIEHLFETEGVSRLGSEVMRESIFCIETLRRAYRLVDVISTRGGVPDEVRASDRKLAYEFNTAALWTQLHIECLRFAITRRTGMPAEILQEILQGQRLAVTAYSLVRQGIELRAKREPILFSTIHDEEDRELLDESFFDQESTLNAES
jgi:hypothetical protein